MARPNQQDISRQSPGELLLARLKEQDLTQVDLATLMGRSPQYVSDMIKGKKRIDSLVALELEEALVTPTAGEWLEIDLKYQQGLQKQEPGSFRRRDVMEKYPFAVEAVRYGWMPDSKNPQELQAHIEQFLAHGVGGTSSVYHFGGQPTEHNFRVGNHESVETSLKAWHTRVYQKAVDEADADFPAYEPEKADQLLAELKECMENESDVVKVKDILRRYGVRFVIIPHLKKAPVDGVASYNGGRPYIGLSLRNGQLDRFWFTLMHEIGHIIYKHSERAAIHMDNIDDRSPKDQFELQADEFARQETLSEERFSQFALRGDHSLVGIQKFARNEGVHPSIVIGRLKYMGWLTWSDFAREHPSVRDNFAGMVDR